MQTNLGLPCVYLESDRGYILLRVPTEKKKKKGSNYYTTEDGEVSGFVFVCFKERERERMFLYV